ncbi:hypothetical protein EDD99_6769 [Streptomyces sp. 846.5]|nr:hypothetical protein [Streptomyces sp. 846.5]TDT98542.1 hypothetical protein EDD99_6769 [Streptomyces sp. 846.5]
MRGLRRSALEVALVHGLLGWLYVAAVAVFRLQDLALPIASPLPVRRDTFGACCFAVSALASFALQLGTGTLWVRRERRRGPVDAALRTIVVYTLLAWAYLGANSITHPETIARQLTHFTDFPTEGTTAVWCFAASAAALFALRTRAATADGATEATEALRHG